MDPYGVAAVGIMYLIGIGILVIDYFVKKKREKS